jgi:hypothetical protein
MTNRWGVPSRVLRNATKYNIPDPVVRHVARRDKSCVYCKLKFRICSLKSSTEWRLLAQCKFWDIWNLFYDNDSQDLEKVLAFEAVDGGRIEWAKVLAAPLYSISGRGCRTTDC